MARTTNTANSANSKRSSTIYENWFSLWRLRHWQAFLVSFGKMKRTPFATMLTVSVIGISLALPTLLLVLLRNVQAVSAGWSNSTQISVFLKMNEPDDAVQQLINQLQADAQIGSVRYISSADGLKQFEKASGFSNLGNTLANNPLPAVLEIKPAPNMQTPEAVQQLLAQLKQLPQVDVVQLDMQWVNRLYAMLSVARHAVFSLAILLGIGVILIIGNTIRLATQHNRPEIEIMKLIGATNAFVRRPFLYTGILYGVAGGLVAWLFVEILLWSLSAPIYQLAQTYQSTISLNGIGLIGTLQLLIFAGLLGFIGSWLVVSRYLNLVRTES
ncbi:MAG: permease-like cell division protein FtsX [Gammaproteobacteria bacterium]